MDSSDNAHDVDGADDGGHWGYGVEAMMMMMEMMMMVVVVKIMVMIARLPVTMAMIAGRVTGTSR